MQPAPGTAVAEPRPSTAVITTLLATAGIAGVIWWYATGEVAADSDAAAALASAEPPSATSFAVAASGPEPRLPAADSGAEDEMQVCGRWVKAGPDGRPSKPELEAVTRTAAEEAIGTAVGLMSASPTPRVQAAAHYFQAGLASVGWAGSQDGKAAARRHRDALAQLAQLTDDPQVYAWAYRACTHAGSDSPGACLQIGAAQWARLDPDNAEPWIAAADEARRRKDDAALDDAMFHVAAARHHHPGFAVMAATVAEYAPQEEAFLLGTEGAVLVALGLEAADGAAWGPVMEYCSAKAIAEANRRETCDRVAQLLVQRSTTVIARDMGTGMARRLGWSAERLDALRTPGDDRSRFLAAKEAHAAPSDVPSCASMRRTIDGIRHIAEFGEIEALRRDTAAFGGSLISPATQARGARDLDPRPNDEAASAAAAASAPSPASPASAASATAVAQR